MRVLIIGSNGRTGRKLADALARGGHAVSTFDLPSDDVLNPSHLERAVSGCDAVICTLGPSDSSPADLCSRGTSNLIAAMKAAHVRRLMCVTGALIGHPSSSLKWFYRRLRKTLESKGLLSDRREQERLVQESGLDWTLIRPPRLSNRRPRGRLEAREDLMLGALASVSREALAGFMATAVNDPSWSHRAVTVID